MKLRSSKAFTLIELLIVVVIIGILAGIVLAVLNPAQQQRRAREGVLQANTGKLCTGLFACAATTTTLANCNSDTLIGVSIPNNTPLGSVYTIQPQGANSIRVTGTLGTCNGYCEYDFANSVATPLLFTRSGSTCIVGGN